MNIDAIDATTNPRGPAGPRTESGKATSSRNAVKNGLFAIHDFVRESETEDYAQLRAALLQQLIPEGILEETFATEILSATWRLRRCRIVEADFANHTTPDQNQPDHNQPDPMTDEALSKEQKSVDRSRAQAHNILRRSMAELRKLQSERTIRDQLELILGDGRIPGLTDTKQVVTTLKIYETQRLATRKVQNFEAMNSRIANAAAAAPNSSFCKPASVVEKSAGITPRNATCPCGSGTKYKRCCGTGAPAQLFPAKPSAYGHAA